MTNIDPHCPGEDPDKKRVPEIFTCPKCKEGEVEIWSDEDSGKCLNCKQTILRSGCK